MIDKVLDRDKAARQGAIAQIAWNEVQEVVTFKVDCLTYDDIRLAFRVDDGWVEIREDAEGWSALTSALGRHFPTIPPDWYETVMLPAFATCYRVLYERAETSDPADPARRESGRSDPPGASAEIVESHDSHVSP